MTIKLEKDLPKNKAGAPSESTPALDTTKKINHTKKGSMLVKFIQLGAKGMNCFEAANRHHDYVLRTTVSDLQRDYGIHFSRKWERVNNSFGSTTDCVRYWLDEANIKLAKAIVGAKDSEVLP